MPPDPILLRVFRHQNQWVFNDAERGLEKEPFVEGAPEIIDFCLRAIRRYPEACAGGFNLRFSVGSFEPPPHLLLHQLLLMEERDGGAVYLHPMSGIEGWLCPSLLLYFDSIPSQIYFSVGV